ncbi:MAG: AAA family ATPase [Verrucomicrobia bacterium]|nr:AAA family ATPase [Verrucomicrobiota bacterium]
MGTLLSLRIKNYRSIHEEIEIVFPPGKPVVIVGENNAGKSNIVRGLDLVLGESWPGSHQPEDHEYFNRDSANVPIAIELDVEGVRDPRSGDPINQIWWRYAAPDDHDFMMETPTATRWVSNDVRGQCFCILVGADRRLAYQMGYASQFTWLSRLMRKFHATLTGDPARVAGLTTKFKELLDVFNGVAEFANFSTALQDMSADWGANFSYRLDIDFSAYDPSNFFRSLRVMAKEDGQVRAFDEVGTGQEQVLALSFAYAYAKAFHDGGGDIILVIEEPEAHLHPLAQEWLGAKMSNMASDGAQILLTTHSPAFVNVLNMDGIVRAVREDGATTVTQIDPSSFADYCRGTGAGTATAENVLPFYAAAATPEILSGLFARRVVLVEGPTEGLALSELFARLGHNASKEGLAIIPVHGKGNLARWWRFFSAYKIPTFVTFDNDATHDPDGTRRSQVLSAMGIDDEELGASLSETAFSVHDSFAVFGEDYEVGMREVFGDAYTQLEEQARAAYGLARDAKPLIARYVAARLDIDSSEEGKQKLLSLIGRALGRDA